MIYSFLIHSADSVALTHFSRLYTSEGNDRYKSSRQQTIVRKILEDKASQQHSASYYPTRLDMRGLSQSTLNALTTSKKVSDMYLGGDACGKSLPMPTEGVVLLSASRIFQDNLAAVWRQFGDLMFSITCARDDNLTLVSNTLILIIEQICRKLGVNKLHKLIADEPDTLELIITPHLNHAAPLILNHSLHRCMIKEDDRPRPFFE